MNRGVKFLRISGGRNGVSLLDKRAGDPNSLFDVHGMAFQFYSKATNGPTNRNNWESFELFNR
jgi:hypothetical protein